MADQVERWFATNGFVSKSAVRHCREGAECDSPGPTPTKNNSATTRPHPRKNWARIIRKLEHHRTARARYRQIGQSQTSKVTAKAPRSPSLRRRQEATGGYRPIAKSLDWTISDKRGIGCVKAPRRSSVGPRLATWTLILRPNRSHPLPSGGQRRELSLHRLATGGYGRRTHIVCCGIVTIRCQAADTGRPAPFRLYGGVRFANEGVWCGSICESAERSHDEASTPEATVFVTTLGER